MFPLRDDNPTEIFPVVTILLIATSVWVWWYVQGAGVSPQALETSICAFGAIPAEVTGAAPSGEGPCRLGGLTWQALLSSMFLHGSWMHLIGNLWFLWIFGNNIEDSMGHLRFLAFYVLTGLAAAGAHVVAEPGSPMPVVGASGAISGIMGAYLVLYPRAHVITAIVFVFIRVVPIPAWVMLGRIKAESGCAIVMAEQNVGYATRVADHCLVLEEGRVVLDGPMATVRQDARLRTAYLGL